MNNKECAIAIKALNETNTILRRFNMNEITSNQAKIYLTNITISDLERVKNEFFNNENLIDTVYSQYQTFDIKKILLYCYYRIKSIPSVLKQSDREVVEYEKSLYKLAKIYIPFNQDMVLYSGSVSNDFNSYNLTLINSKTVLYNKTMPSKKLKLDDIYDILIDALEYSDVLVTFKDPKLAQTIQAYIHYNGLIKTGLRPSEIMNIDDNKIYNYPWSQEFSKNCDDLKKELYMIPEIRSQIDENNLYAIAASRFLQDLNICLADYETNGQSKFLNIPFLTNNKNILEMLCNNIEQDKTSLAITKDNKSSVFNVNECIDEWKDILDKLANFYIQDKPMEAYNPQVLSLMSKESAEKLIDSQKYKNEYYYALYQAEHITFSEMIEYVKAINPEYDDVYRVRATIFKLTDRITMPQEAAPQLTIDNDDISKFDNKKYDAIEGNKIVDYLCESENFFSVTLDDDSLYEMLNENLFRLFALYSMEQIENNGMYAEQARKNIDVMLKKGSLTPEIIASLYVYNNVSINDIEKIIRQDRLVSLYNADDFINIYKDINEIQSESDLSEEKNEQLSILQKEYNFYKDLFTKLGYLGNEEREVELLDLLGDLLDDKQTLKKFYTDGMLSIENVYGLNSEVCTEIYKENLLRNTDIKYITFHTDTVLTTGDLIRLSNEGHIDTADVFKMYMQGKYNLDTLKAYSEGLDTNDIFNDDDLLSKARKYGIMKDEAVINDFQRYLSAYLQIKGEPTHEIKQKIYKAIGGKNSKGNVFIELYNKGLINIKTIDFDNFTLLTNMIKQGVLRADDEEFLFKDTEADGKKYLRLTKILPLLNQDQKINLLASVYSTIDDISKPRINFLSSYLDEVVEDKQSKSEKVKDQKVQKDENEKKVAKAQAKKNIFAFGSKFKTFKEIDPNYRHEIASGSYVIDFKRFNGVVLEEIYRTTTNGNSFETQHATYILKGTDEVMEYLKLDRNNDFYEELLSKIIFQNSKGVNCIEWSKLIQMNRDGIKGISKCLHTTEERWKNTLKKKIGYEDPNVREKINDCLNNIEQTALDFANENVDNNDMEH